MKNLTLLSIFFLLISCSKESAKMANGDDVPLESRSHEAVPSIEFNGTTLYIHPTDISINGNEPFPRYFIWGEFGIKTGATSHTDGKENTETIVNVLGNYNNGRYAAKLCADLIAFGHDDWYLPSKEELKAICESGYFPMDHWSSTEQNKNMAWVSESGGELAEHCHEWLIPDKKEQINSSGFVERCRCIRRD